jgi:glycine dehydrogenase subunit 2
VSKTLVPFLPSPTVERDPAHNDQFVFESDRSQSIGKVKDFYGHFLMMVRAYTYIRELGAQGIREAGEHAILLANYIRCKLQDDFEVAFDRPCMHEVVFNDQRQNKNGVKTLDIAKRLIDLGTHPPTVYFPLIVPGALMVEPTETESLQSVDGFIAAMKQIAREASEPGAFDKYFANAPKEMPFGRINETKAAKDLKLTWKG